MAFFGCEGACSFTVHGDVLLTWANTCTDLSNYFYSCIQTRLLNGVSRFNTTENKSFYFSINTMDIKHKSNNLIKSSMKQMQMQYYTNCIHWHLMMIQIKQIITNCEKEGSLQLLLCLSWHSYGFSFKHCDTIGREAKSEKSANGFTRQMSVVKEDRSPPLQPPRLPSLQGVACPWVGGACCTWRVMTGGY